MDFLEENLFFMQRRPELFVGELPGRNVGIDLQDANGLAVHIELQRPAAPNRSLCAIAQRMDKFSFPAVLGKQNGLDIRHRLGKYRAQQFIADLADRFRTAPAVILRSRLLPERNSPIPPANYNHVPRQPPPLTLL